MLQHIFSTNQLSLFLSVGCLPDREDEDADAVAWEMGVMPGPACREEARF